MTKVFRTLESAAGHFGPCALTIGNFDGVHIGHQELIRQTVARAKESGGKAGVMTFHPHPAAVLAPERAPKLLCSLEERIERLTAFEIDELLVLPFTKELAQLTAEEFIQRVLVEALRTRFVLVGENFRFGYQQGGTTELLQTLGPAHRFAVELLQPVRWRGEIVSSTAVRKQITEGNVVHAGRLLGRCYSLRGLVVTGHGIGSKQTVPTLNLAPETEVLPTHGVYATRTRDRNDGRMWNSITNIGIRPTFDGNALSIETFLLSEFDGKTPQEIEVSFLRYVRPERKFETPEALKQQIFLDVARANTLHRRLRHWTHTDTFQQ